MAALTPIELKWVKLLYLQIPEYLLQQQVRIRLLQQWCVLCKTQYPW